MVHTKAIIRNAFWQILEEKPYNKITVQDIVNKCQVNRNTFYYHFQDIPKLMTDSIEEWIDDMIQRYARYESPEDCLTCMAQEFMKRKKAFLNLFRNVQRDVFWTRMNQMAYDIVYTYVEKIGKFDSLSKHEKETLVKCDKCLFTGVLLDWFEEGASYDLVGFYKEICKRFPEPEAPAHDPAHNKM